MAILYRLASFFGDLMVSAGAKYLYVPNGLQVRGREGV
jgi:hypothetical protein